MCANTLIADWSPLLSAYVGSNSNAVQMGWGTAGKSASIYQVSLTRSFMPLCGCISHN